MRGLGDLFGPLALRGRTHDALAVRLFAAERCRCSRCFPAQLEQRLWFGMLGLHVINGVVFDYLRAAPVPDGLRGISPDGPRGAVDVKRSQRACWPRYRAMDPSSRPGTSGSNPLAGQFLQEVGQEGPGLLLHPFRVDPPGVLLGLTVRQ